MKILKHLILFIGCNTALMASEPEFPFTGDQLLEAMAEVKVETIKFTHNGPVSCEEGAEVGENDETIYRYILASQAGTFWSPTEESVLAFEKLLHPISGCEIVILDQSPTEGEHPYHYQYKFKYQAPEHEKETLKIIISPLT